MTRRKDIKVEEVYETLKQRGKTYDKIYKNKEGTWYKKIKKKIFSINVIYTFAYVRLTDRKDLFGVVVLERSRCGKIKVHIMADAFDIINNINET